MTPHAVEPQPAVPVQAAAPASAYVPSFLWRRRRPMPEIVARLVLAHIVAAASFVFVSAPAEAQARFVSGEVGFDAEAMHVVFTTTEEVASPRVSSEPGAFRVRFSDATDAARLDVVGDGGALRFARVRPGAGDATVVVLRLTDRRHLPADALTVTREGTRVDLSIPRSLLAPARIPEPERAVAEPAPPSAPSEPVAAPAAAPEPEPTGDLLAPPAPLFIGGARPPGATAAPRAESWTSGRNALLVVLAAASALVLGVFHWLRTRKRAGRERLAISVVASHRISPRHQLVVVRALGQDHLLSIDGNKTERISSSPSPIPDADPNRAERDSVPGNMPGGMPDFGKELTDLLRPDVSRVATMLAPAASASNHVAHHAGFSAPPPAASDAVAGLLRLRARAFR